MSTIKVMLLGDVVGSSGRAIFKKHAQRLRREHAIDALIVNGENSSHGRGITSVIADFFKANGADVITTGNHVWQRQEVFSYLDNNKDVLKPANYPSNTPGVGVTTVKCAGHEIGVINVQGRVFMRENLDCPLRKAETLVQYLAAKTKLIFVDFHAEATSEKHGLAYFLDGKVTGVVGTHTHIQTADERVLPGGTAYITDLGMAGSLNSMLGMQKEPIIRQLLTQMPVRFAVDTQPPFVMSGVVVTADTATGKAIAIERIRIVDEDICIE